MRGSLLGNLSNLICNNDTFSLWRCCRFCDPQLFFVFFHLSLQISELIWEKECFWYKVEVFGTMNLTHLGDLLVHQIFSCDIVRLREVINLLISEQTLINLRLHGWAAPHDGPILTLLLRNFSEAVIFQGISDDLHIAFMKLEVVTAVRRLERTQCNRIFIGSEHQVLLFKLCDYWLRGWIIRNLVKLWSVSCRYLWVNWILRLEKLLLFFFIIIFLSKLSGDLNFLPDRSTYAAISRCLGSCAAND